MSVPNSDSIERTLYIEDKNWDKSPYATNAPQMLSRVGQGCVRLHTMVSRKGEHMLTAYYLLNTANDNTEVIIRKIRECTSKISKVHTGFIVNVKKVC